jgi:hypothetical protein
LLAGVLFFSFLAGVDPSTARPSVAADLDGDGAVETIMATPSPDGVRLEVRDAAGRARASAVAAAPGSGTVTAVLAAAPIGSAGALVELTARAGSSECRTVWRYRDGRLTRLPLRDAGGQELPDCAGADGWTYRWEDGGAGRPSILVRETVENTATESFRRREAFAFAGFSLDYDPAHSSSEINGVPIPSWYPAILYTRGALETLYGRFDLAAMRSEPTLKFEADRRRGIFRIRFGSPAGEVTASVGAYDEESGTATLTATVGEQTGRISVSLAGEKHDVPIEARVEGLRSDLDQQYAPAGSWRGGSRHVFESAADEIASEDLAGSWNDPRGRAVLISLDGAVPYRVRMGADTFSVDMNNARPPADLLLRSVKRGGPVWGVSLRGPNAIERTPYRCGDTAPDAARTSDCAPDGAGEVLRRIGARINVP